MTARNISVFSGYSISNPVIPIAPLAGVHCPGKGFTMPTTAKP